MPSPIDLNQTLPGLLPEPGIEDKCTGCALLIGGGHTCKRQLELGAPDRGSLECRARMRTDRAEVIFVKEEPA